MKPLVECVPNFSEGRRLEVVEAIVEAMRDVDRVQILDVQSDADHNRSVVTLVGPPAAVQEAAFQGIARAAELIDLDEHRGEHPRLGATDVVPFVPVEGVTMEECVALARDLGRRVGEELHLPVYFYEAAALLPERVRLENVRRGEYERLREEIAVLEERKPDAGPAEVSSAGAVVIGARPYLIAFNAYLNTDDVAVARRIARAVRGSNGGLRGVKALGMLVAGRAQVSMNLTDFTTTPIHQAVELIRSEARRYGCAVTHTELVGLVPEKALVDAARWHLQLDLFSPEQILERRLAGLDEGAPRGFLEAVSAGRATPAGGSVAALAGALAAALAAMVGRLTTSKRTSAEVRQGMAELVVQAERLRERLTRLVEKDQAAYEAVLAAYKLPQDGADELDARTTAIQRALTFATEVPLATAQDALMAMELALEAARAGHTNAIADAAAGAWMAMAAIRVSALNARVNSASIADEARRERWLGTLEEIERRAETTLEAVQAAVAERGGV